MTNFIPIFPLAMVVFPGELFSLHIFEPRYKQLIKECAKTKKPFGIPVVINDKVREYGTLVQVKDILKTYDDGKMDIEVKGIDVFQILEQITHVPDKLYNGAIVSYPQNTPIGNLAIMTKVVAKIKELHSLINIKKDFGKNINELTTYMIAHYAGLSLQEEYDFLQLTNELHRQEYLRRYLNQRLTAVKAVIKTEQSKSHLKDFMGFSLN